MARFATRKAGRYGNVIRKGPMHFSEKALAARKARSKAKAKATMDAVKSEIMEFLRSGGASRLKPRDLQSRYALATALIRGGIVRSSRAQHFIADALVSLARGKHLKGLLVLPPKTKGGVNPKPGRRKKRAKKK